jgi:hypothetical protein
MPKLRLEPMRNSSLHAFRDMQDRFTRRSFVLAGTAVLVSGCAKIINVGNGGWVLDGQAPETAAIRLSRREIESQPKAMLRLRQGREIETLMTQTRGMGRDLHWISPRRLLVATRKGRLVKSVGLRANLRTTQFLSPDPVAVGLHRADAPMETKRIVDLSGGQRFGRLIISRFEIVGPTTISIAEISHNVLLVKERNEMAPEGWRFENSFWVDPRNGFVWRSIQHLAPEVPPVEIDILKPAKGGL